MPSIAFFFLLLPITGRGTDTAIIALTAYTLQIIYRNIVAGLANVPGEAKDSGRGMGMTPRQLLWRVELPLAVPEIIAGLRIATVSTVAIATLAVFAGAGGPGRRDRRRPNLTFKTGIIICGGIAIGMAIGFDALLVGARRLTVAPWRRSVSTAPGLSVTRGRARAGVTSARLPRLVLGRDRVHLQQRESLSRRRVPRSGASIRSGT